MKILVLALSFSTIRAELNYTALTKFTRYSGTHSVIVALWQWLLAAALQHLVSAA